MNPHRDGNSSENFTPRGIEESRNGNLTYLGDRGRQIIFLGVLEEFRGPFFYAHLKTIKNFELHLCKQEEVLNTNNSQLMSLVVKYVTF